MWNHGFNNLANLTLSIYLCVAGLPCQVDKVLSVDEQSMRLQSFSHNNQKVPSCWSRDSCGGMGGVIINLIQTFLKIHKNIITIRNLVVVLEGNIFTGICQSSCSQGVYVVKGRGPCIAGQ